METAARQTTVDRTALDAILERYPREEPSLIQVLQDIQRHYHYLPAEALERVSQALGVPLARVCSVATFYKAFSLHPQGEHLVHVCTGTACHVRGAPQILDEIHRRLDLDAHGTSADMQFTVKTVNCVGACAMAPVVIVDGRYHGAVQANRLAGILGLAKKGGES